MSRNIEIKARLSPDQFASIQKRLKTLATSDCQQLRQTDTFFQATFRALKLREFADGTGEVIGYHRPDVEGPKTSNYWRSVCEPAAMKAALQETLGIVGVVKKVREVTMIGQTRVHLDQVEGMGCFLELEVVLTDNETEETGTQIAQQIMDQLNVPRDSLVSGSYFDLMSQ